MKKIISTVLCLMFLFSSLTAFAAVNAPHRNGIKVIAEGECGKELVWILYDDGELDIEITNKMEVLLSNYRLIKKYNEDCSIDYGLCNMYNYNAEEAPWYKYRGKIKSVVVKEDVTYLGNYAFYDCKDIKTIDIQSDLLSEIGYDCFWGCNSLENINIPQQVEIIGSSAFENCSNLKEIQLPKNLTEIYPFTFANCTSLSVVETNNIISSIDTGAFTNCSKLESLVIPKSVSKIGSRALYGCSKLALIQYEGSESDWHNINIDSSNNNILNECDFIFGEENNYEENKIICAICGKEIASDEVIYNSDNQPICLSCINDNEEGINKNEQKCYICGEYFNTNDILYDEDDNLICQGCYDELQNKDEELFYIQCPYCEETFEDNEDIYDEDGYVVCPDCDECIDYDYDEDDEYEDINEIKCPHCDKTFEEINDVYDEYGYIRCPYCDGYVLTETEYYEEIEFTTSAWAEDEVYEAYQNNLIPNEMLEDVLYNTVTREEFVAIAVKLYENITGEIPYANTNNMPFTDCNTDSKYISYIAVAYKLGITNGTTQTTFSPYDNISREQLTAMLYRVIKLVENNKTFDFDVNNVRKFFDDSDISDYAKESVYFMAEYGIVKGIDSAHFAPLDTATKEQSILISVRCVNSLFKD